MPDPGSLDVMVLQTAASLENLLVDAYSTAADLAFVKGGNAMVSAFIARTGAQHAAHARAFNAAAGRAGGSAQDAADPRYAPSVMRALAALSDPASVASLMTTLEDVAAQTYTRYVSLVGAPDLRTLFCSVAPVEAQHRSILLVVQSLLNGGEPDLIAAPTRAAQLPNAVGTVGLPESFYSTTDASAVSEGTVR
jgi:Ferritin-like domain